MAYFVTGATGFIGRRLVEQLPVMIALQEHRPAHRWMDIIDLHGARQRVEATAFPVRGGDGDVLGAVALFWRAELF